MDKGSLPHFLWYSIVTILYAVFGNLSTFFKNRLQKKTTFAISEKIAIVFLILIVYNVYNYKFGYRGLSMTVKIILIVIYSLLTLALVTMKALNWGDRRRGVTKMLTSVMFVGVGVYGCILNNGHLSIVLVVGLLFASVGDLLLIFMDNHKIFVAGVLSFAAASVTLSIYAILNYGWTFWTILPFVIVVAANIVGQATKAYTFGRDVVDLNVYTVCVGLCGSLGIAIACSVGSVQAVLFGLGCFMYMLSDICLGLYLLKFRYRALGIVNSLLYFPGMLLIALSLIF